jgi:hypothetical protein
MDSPINTRLAVLDALGWPIGIALWLVVQSDYHVGGAHGMAFVFLGVWAMRKLFWALDGYGEPEGESWIVFNPFNPFSWLLAGLYAFLGPKHGPYSYTTTTLLVWILTPVVLGLIAGGIAKLFT